jgi:AcrR family transcriptional regulator
MHGRLQAEMHVDTAHSPSEAGRILAATLDLGEERGFENVRLADVAERVGLPLGEVHRHFADLDAVANAWFAEALQVAIEIPPEAILGLTPPARLEAVMMRWFDVLAPRRRLAGEIVQAKLWPALAHHWVPMVFDLSRLMHWFLDAARITSTGRRRALAEVGLTLTFLGACSVFLREREPDSPNTRRFLARRLTLADRMLGLMPGS